VPSTKISSGQESTLKPRNGGDPPRRQATTYSMAFFFALVIGILSALGFLGLLVFAVAG